MEHRGQWSGAGAALMTLGWGGWLAWVIAVQASNDPKASVPIVGAVLLVVVGVVGTYMMLAPLLHWPPWRASRATTSNEPVERLAFERDAHTEGQVTKWEETKRGQDVVIGQASEKDTATPITPRQVTLEHLRSVVGKYANDHTNASIKFYPPDKEPLSQRIASIFESAKWVTFRANMPQPMGQYLSGIQVSGHLEYLVDGITDAFRDGNFSVSSQIVKTTIQPTNPKYDRAIHRINIAIGYDES